MTDKLKEGDRVRIDPSSEHYGASNSNPMYCTGTIRVIVDDSDDVWDGYDYSVAWDNDTENVYRREDLIKI